MGGTLVRSRHTLQRMTQRDDHNVLTFGTVKVLLPTTEDRDDAWLVRPASAHLIDGLPFPDAEALERQIDQDHDEAHAFVAGHGLTWARPEGGWIDLDEGGYAFPLTWT